MAERVLAWYSGTTGLRQPLAETEGYLGISDNEK